MAPPTTQQYIRERILLILVVALSLLVTLALSSLAGIPRVPGYSGSLLLQLSPVLAVVVAFASLLVSGSIGTLIGARVHREAGIFAAGAGLSVLAVRCGSVAPLLHAKRESLYSVLAAEMAVLGILYAVVGVIAGYLLRGKATGQPTVDKTGNGLKALGLQVLSTAVAMFLFARGADKKTALAAAGISGFAGSLVAHGFAPSDNAHWYWPGPLIAGLLGYIWAMLSPGAWSAIGVPANGLAAATPLDYASLGVAGAVWGFWMSQRWAAERAAQQASEHLPTSAQPGLS